MLLIFQIGIFDSSSLNKEVEIQLWFDLFDKLINEKLNDVSCQRDRSQLWTHSLSILEPL